MNYSQKASTIIKIDNMPKTPLERSSQKVKDLLNSNDYVIDAHAHLFDIKCINKAYFVIRFLKDFLGLKSSQLGTTEFSEKEIYQEIHDYDEGWEDRFEEELKPSNINVNHEKANQKGIIDLFNARKFLGFKRMEDVYKHYIRKFSLAKHFDLDDDKVLLTGLMMDLETGWGVRINKKLSQQISELRDLSQKHPVLPFLFCDPRRADLEDSTENLYHLFNKAFCTENAFFGVKIYPALGYDPSDHRLWPIYEICEKYKIPVLTHCGGESISSDDLNLKIFEGEKEVACHFSRRKGLAFSLNDPNRWKLVLEKFPNLKLNFGHFGGYETWRSSTPLSIQEDNQKRKETIIEFMQKYPNVYADFSYNLIEIDLSKNLKNMLFFNEKCRERTIFGSDYWVVNKAGNLLKEQSFFLNLLDNGIDEYQFSDLLCRKNPYNYLFT